MVDKFLTNKSQQSIFQKKENIFHQPRAEIHLNYYERPELEIIDNNPSGNSFFISDKNLNYSTISFDKKQPSYAGIHMKKIQENKQDTKFSANLDNHMSFDYSTQFSSPGKSNSSKPPLPKQKNTNGKQSRKNQTSQLCNYSNYTPIDRSSEISHDENNYSKIPVQSLNQGAQEKVYNFQSNSRRENNFSSNDHNTSRRSNSNNSRKSNGNTSISSVNGYLEKRHMETQQRVNRLKMEKMKKEQDELRPIPQISENSKKIAEGLFNSGDVVDRLTYSKFEKKNPISKQINTNEVNKSQDVNKIEKVLIEMKKANKELQLNTYKNPQSISNVKHDKEEKILVNQSIELVKKDSNTNPKKTQGEYGTPQNGRQKISNSIDRKKEYSNSIKRSFQPIKLRRDSRDGSLNKSIEKNSSPNVNQKLIQRKLPIKEKSYNENQDTQKDQLLNVRKSLHEYLSSRPRTNHENVGNQISSQAQKVGKNLQEYERKVNPSNNSRGDNNMFQYNDSKVNNLINYIDNTKVEHNYQNHSIPHDHDYDSVKAHYPFSHIPHIHAQNISIHSSYNYNDKPYEKNLRPPYQPVSYSVNLSSLDSQQHEIKNKTYSNYQNHFDNERRNTPDYSHKLLSNEEVYSIVKNNTQLSEERKIIFTKEKIRILEEEMIKISKLNGLKLQEPPSPSEYVRKSNYSINPKFANDQNNLNIAMQREGENSVDYHNINTSYSETQKNNKLKVDDNTISNIQQGVMSSYNFKNPIQPKKSPLDGGNKNNTDSEHIENCLNNTNEKLRNLNNAKQNLSSKMEFSFRDVSKFLKN